MGNVEVRENNAGAFKAAMTYDPEPLYWQTDKRWWKIVDGKFVLTDEAPERARKSFELFNSTPEKL